jgi:hypothetical protein
MLKQQFKEWSGTIALIVAVFAFFVSIFNACETREHNRLSLRPYLTIDFGVDETGAGWRYFQNGLGLAIIKAFEVKVDEKQVTGWKSLLETLNISADAVNYRILGKGSAIMPSNNTGILMWVKGPSQAAKALAIDYKRVKMKLCYCSLYEECWITSNMYVNKEREYRKVKACPESKVQFVNDFL